jgi:hypothetical protein
MEGLDKGGQGPTSDCCAIEEEDGLLRCYIVYFGTQIQVPMLRKIVFLTYSEFILKTEIEGLSETLLSIYKTRSSDFSEGYDLDTPSTEILYV